MSGSSSSESVAEEPLDVRFLALLSLYYSAQHTTRGIERDSVGEVLQFRHLADILLRALIRFSYILFIIIPPPFSSSCTHAFRSEIIMDILKKIRPRDHGRCPLI
jgi:hypothetical protein